MELPLRDIHLPAAIQWWPLAIGWWIVIVCAALLVLLSIFYIIKAFKPTLKKHATKTLNGIEQTFIQSQDSVHCLAELSVFLRRVVLSQANGQKYAGLTGLAWLECLDKPLKKPEFSQGVGRILLSGPYQPQIETADVSQLIALCRKWVKSI